MELIKFGYGMHGKFAMYSSRDGKLSKTKLYTRNKIIANHFYNKS